MNTPDEQEISDKRDDAADAARTSVGEAVSSYAQGVRDALGWVLGDNDAPEL